MSGPDPLAILRVLVEAHDQPHPRTGSREPIIFSRFIGGSSIQHHGFAEGGKPDVDEAVLSEMQVSGWLDIDYTGNSWCLVPTPEGRHLVEQHDRVNSSEPVADTAPLLAAVTAQTHASNKLGWPVVRPVLVALRDYWEAGGFSPYGIQLRALIELVPEEQDALFAATVRGLMTSDYLVSTTALGLDTLPAEVALTDKAHQALDGWPGAAPEDLVENLLAVLTTTAAAETDPAKKKRFQKLADGVRELGVATASEVIAKVVAGG